MGKELQALEQYLQAHSLDLNGESPRLREVAYRRLADALQNVDLEPNTPLPETYLSQLLGISRTPVREALQELAKDGLIQMVNGRAITVAARSAQELFDALSIREMLEPEVMRLAATHLPAPQLERLQQCTSEMERAAQAADRDAWSRADREWHEILCDACPNQLLGQMVMQARHRMYRKGSDEYVVDQYLIDGTQEHRLIVEAIASQDGAAASQLMLEHLDHLRENMFRRLIRR